jgi:hypothetical protein
VTLKKETIQIAHIDLRIHPHLKLALNKHCEVHLEKISEAVTNSIKNYIGFGKPAIDKSNINFEQDEGKSFRLNIRVHPRLKEALEEYCKKNNEKYTLAVTNAIKQYIGYSEGSTLKKVRTLMEGEK